MFHTDDAMFLSKAVTAMPANHRLAALGLWQTVGQWCAHEGTEGYVTLDQIRQLSPLGTRSTNHLIGLLVDLAGLWSRVTWADQPAVLFRDWDVWQDTAEQVKSRRDGWRERKRRQRAAAQKNTQLDANSSQTHPQLETQLDANSGPTSTWKGHNLDSSENVPRDVPRDVTPMSRPPLSHNPKESSTYVEQQSHVSNAREPEPPPRPRTFTAIAGGNDRHPPAPPDPGPTAIPARELVKRIIPADYPVDERGKLAHQATRLMQDGTSVELVEAALQLWLTKPHAGPGLLPSLVSEIIKTRHPQTPNGASQPMGRASAKAQGILDATAELIASRHQPQPGEIEA